MMLFAGSASLMIEGIVSVSFSQFLADLISSSSVEVGSPIHLSMQNCTRSLRHIVGSASCAPALDINSSVAAMLNSAALTWNLRV